ncbi:MAG: twin-arginine translocase subunit TatC [Anaerolineae bacterium]
MQRVKTPPPPKNGTPEEDPGAQMSLLEHIEELRDRLLKAMLALLFGTVIGFLFADKVMAFLQAPYGQRFKALGPTDAVVEFFRVALMLGGIIAIPIITYQLLMFILPGLTSKERRFVLMSLPAVFGLFLIGVFFAWFLLIPPALNFLQNFQPTLFESEWTAELYLGFVTTLIFWMGVAFQTPLLFFVISLLGFVTPGALIRNWRFAVVGAAGAAAIITPTVDPVNMFLVMAPLMGLYAFSILLVAIGVRMNPASRA